MNPPEPPSTAEPVPKYKTLSIADRIL